jgi:hypothetical protein
MPARPGAGAQPGEGRRARRLAGGKGSLGKGGRRVDAAAQAVGVLQRPRHAVERGHLASNPVDRIQWTTPAVAQSVDRRVVVSPAQARQLLAAVRGLSGRGAHLEAFYACLYYAALRPSERSCSARAPRKPDAA